MAQDTPTNPVQDVRELDVAVRRMAAFLKSLPSYHIEVRQQWSVGGEQPSKGANQYQLTVRNPASYRLEVTSPVAAKKNALMCVSDGKATVRMFTFGETSIYSSGQGGLDQMLKDRMTDTTLKDSWLDVVSHPNLHADMMASVANVKYLGENEVAGVKTKVFQLDWQRTPGCTLWFGTGDRPLLVQALGTFPFSPQPDKKQEMTVKTRLVWKTGDTYGEELFRVKIPQDAMKVSDIHASLIEGGTRDLLGQPAPSVQLKQLDGQPWRLRRHQGKDTVVIFFWSTWAVPSTEHMPAVLDFVEKYKQQGVAFYAINVGQAENEVRTHLQNVKHDVIVVLDSKEAAAKAFRVTSLPTTLLVGKDGTLQAVHVGSGAHMLKLIDDDLRQLLSLEKP